MSSSSNKSKDNTSSEDGSDVRLRRGPWTLEEDTLLIHYIASHGEGRWNLLAKRAGLRRTGKSCRLRWLNYLKPDVKRGNLTPQEQLLILELHSKFGNRWSKIVQHLPGRTDNEIKNYWRTRVQKQAKQLKLDVNSTTFQEIIRCYWIPRLLQKIEGSTSQTMTPQPTIVSNQPMNILTQFSQYPQLPTPLELKEHVATSSCTSSCISSIESMDHNISQVSQFPQCLKDPLNITSNNFDNITSMKDFCHVDNTFHASNLTSMVGGAFGNPNPERHVAESDWIDYNIEEYSMWNNNMDELW